MISRSSFASMRMAADARFRTAQALSRLAKKKDACEVITVTQSLHPDLQDEELKARFARLRDEVCIKDKP